MDRTLLILGAGGHGKSVAEAALLAGVWQNIVFLDDAWPQVSEAFGFAVAGKVSATAEWQGRCQGASAAVGNNVVREQWIGHIEGAGIELVSVIHPRSWVSPSAVIGAGTAVMAGAVVGTVSSLGKGVIVKSNATVDHDVVIGVYAHMGVGVLVAGGVKGGCRVCVRL